MTTEFHYKLALSICDSKMEYLTAHDQLDALYAMHAYAVQQEERENARLKKVYPNYKSIQSEWPDKIDGLIARFRLDNFERLESEMVESVNRTYEDSQAKQYH